MASNNLIPALISILDPGHLERLNEWPSNGSLSSVDLVRMLITQVISVFYLPFATDDLEQNLLELLQQIMYNYELVKCALGCVKYLTDDFLELPMGLLQKLVCGDKLFVKQFIDFGGLESKIVNQLLQDKNPKGVLTDALLILGQLARLSKDNYEAIHHANAYTAFYKLLSHEEPNIRAKMCNLVGNMCKHSVYFYAELKKYRYLLFSHLPRHKIIAAVIKCCSDPDRNTRKFACFAVGNACFHSDALYEVLRPCIPSLVRLLDDPEEKTRSNAAGALGNLARNSNLLVADRIPRMCITLLSIVIKNDVVHHLLQVLDNSADNSLSTHQVVLFSLGTLCSFPEIKSNLANTNILSSIKQRFTHSSDSTIQKYLTRIAKALAS